jgi:4-hydroxybenzoyl-CoA reductase subunit beta
MVRAHKGALVVAGGTDSVPKMKRGQFDPDVVISLLGVAELDFLHVEGDRVRIGPLTKLRRLEHHEAIRPFTSFHRALERVATPIIRNSATLGGNLLQDTRCRYYDRSSFWRSSLGYCMKKGADDCKVAPGGQHCYAALCSDLGPALAVLDAEVTILGTKTRTLPLEAMYQEDGMAHMKFPGDLLTEITVPKTSYRSTYSKLRIRDGFDFPEIGVAVAVADADAGRIRVNVAVSGASSTVQCFKQTVDRSKINDLIDDIYKVIKPMDLLFFPPAYRRQIAKRFMQRSLDELLSA